MAAVRAIGAGLEQTAREAARADVKIAVRNIVVVGELVAVWDGIIDVFTMSMIARRSQKIVECT